MLEFPPLAVLGAALELPPLAVLGAALELPPLAVLGAALELPPLAVLGAARLRAAVSPKPVLACSRALAALTSLRTRT